MTFDYSKMFSEPVFEFLNKKSQELGSSIGYVVPSLLTSTAYILATNDATFQIGTHLQPLNLYTMMVGHPGTGKSPAIESILSALKDMECIPKETVVSATTSSGLVKNLSKQGKSFIASPELFDVVNKLLKNDEENGSGDVQLLCKLWSGESASYHFATESTREIDGNTPFSILGATQIQNAASLIYRMDKGHGLLDRFLISVPFALKPTPQSEEEAANYLSTLPFSDFKPFFSAVAVSHKNLTRTYSLGPPAAESYRQLKTDHVNEVNRAVENGDVPPKSKGADLVVRVAVAISTIDHFISALLENEAPTDPPEKISQESFDTAVLYVQHLHAHKEMFADFVKEITTPSTEQPRTQPSTADIKAAVLRFPGRVVTFQAFKKYSPRRLRSVQKQEYGQCLQAITTFGTVVELRVPRCAQKLRLFIKKPVATIQPWPTNAPCSPEDYAQKIAEPMNSLITPNVQNALVNAGHITQEDITG